MPKLKYTEPEVKTRWKAYAPDGKFRETVLLTRDTKKWYEARGWTFRRTSTRDWV